MPAQIVFLAQHLTMEQPCDRGDVNQSDPIWKDEEFTDQDNRKCYIDGIAAESENAVRYQSVGMVRIDADSKTLPKGNDAPQQQ